MNTKALFVVFIALITSNSVYAEIDVLVSTGSSEHCEKEDDGREWCTGENRPAEYVKILSAEESAAINNKISQQFALLQSENKILKDLITQRDADIKFLSKKADESDKRLMQLEKALKDLSDKKVVLNSSGK